MKTTKIIITVFVLAALLTLLPGMCSAQGEKTLEDRQSGYRLKYPADWKGRVFTNSTNLIKAEVTKGSGDTGLQVRVYEKVNKSLASFGSWFVTDMTGQMENHWGGKMNLLDKKALPMGKQNALVITFRFDRKDGKKYFFKEYLWKKGNRIYLIQSGTPYQDRSRAEPILDGIAGSFEITK